MLFKFVFTNKETGESKEYKTLRKLASDLNVDYFQVRSIYLESKSPKKYLHPITKQLVEKYSIKDNPNLFH
jgi:signal-transduction protein with cAMP-binding, CBS, and nucleotidyltransferase domain